MRINRLAISALVLLVAAAALQPAQAACPGAPGLNTISSSSASYMFRAGWPTGAGACYTFGCYEAPLANPKGDFWALGDGANNNNGGFPASDWVNVNCIGPYSQGLYCYYPGAFVSTNWNASAAISGCVFADNATPGGECTCMLITDDDGSTTYAALLGARMNDLGNTFFDQPGNAPLVLQPLPVPKIAGAIRNETTLNLDSITVTIDAGELGAVEYLKDMCNCGNTSFLVRGQLLPRDSDPPTNRETASWPLLALAGGGMQTPTDSAASVDVESMCGGSDTDLWLATELIFDSGFETRTVSGNATKIECGPNLARPIDRRDNDRPNRDVAPRRDRDRGR